LAIFSVGIAASNVIDWSCSIHYYLQQFPKDIWRQFSDTYLYHIDVFNDYLALAGDTWDNSLTGITTPFYSVFSFDIDINRRQVLLGQSFIFKDRYIFCWSVI
jgi:hypothetical protein